MAASNAAVERWAPRLICWSVSNAKKRSTWLIQDADVGVKCICQWGRLANQSRINLVLWLDAFSMSAGIWGSVGTFFSAGSGKGRKSCLRGADCDFAIVDSPLSLTGAATRPTP